MEIALDAARAVDMGGGAIRREVLTEAIDTARRLGDRAALLQGLLLAGGLYAMIGDDSDGLAWLDEAEPLARATGDRSQLADVYYRRGAVVNYQGRWPDGHQLYREALERKRRVLGDDHPDTLVSINNMGYLLVAQRRLKDAEPLYREALERRRKVLGDDHPDTLVSINNMGSLLYEQGKVEAAIPLLLEVLERRRRVRLSGRSDHAIDIGVGPGRRHAGASAEALVFAVEPL